MEGGSSVQRNVGEAPVPGKPKAVLQEAALQEPSRQREPQPLVLQMLPWGVTLVIEAAAVTVVVQGLAPLEPAALRAKVTPLVPTPLVKVQVTLTLPEAAGLGMVWAPPQLTVSLPDVALGVRTKVVVDV